MKRLLLVLFFLVKAAAFAQTNELKSAEEKYLAGDYKGAVQIYEKRLQSNVNGELLYNLGNCYYRLNEIGKAIAAYKGSLEFLPRDADAQANYEQAKKQRVDIIEEEINYKKIFFFWINWMNLHEYLLLFSFFSLTMLLIFLIRFKFPLPKNLFGGALSLLSLSLVLFLCKYYFVANDKQGVVVQKEVQVRSGPEANNMVLFTLHEGVELALKRDSGAWVEVFSVDGKRGWILKESLVRVRNELNDSL